MERVFELLTERARRRAYADTVLERVTLGLSWSVVRAGAVGLCFSPTSPPRNLNWPGTLEGRAARDVVPWLRSNEWLEAVVGGAVVNALINDDANPCLARAEVLHPRGPAHLGVFEHFRAQVEGAYAVVVGRYPGLDLLWNPADYVCLERSDLPGTVPPDQAPRELGRADWVFLTGSSITNHTLPALLRAIRPGAKKVLLGPSVPWLEEWADFGVDYLAGVRVVDPPLLEQIVREGGGTRIFEAAVRYQLVSLS